MSRAGKKLEDLFAAASFAESGEFDTARELLGDSKQVLLVLTGRENDTKSLTYALSIAKRTEAGLEVLSTSTSQRAAEIVALCEQEARLNSVTLKTSKAKGCVKDALIAYTKKRRDIICVVIESTEALKTDCSRDDKSLTGIYKELGCPLALVTDKA